MRRALAIAFVLAAAAAPASAATSFNDVEAALMCDTCNVPLAIAESPRADQERVQIRRLIAQGKTKREILDAFVAEYGPNVLAEPEGGGGAVAVWVVPAAILVAAAIAILLLLPRWKRHRRAGGDDDASSGAPAEQLSKDDAERLERDLALYDL